MNPGLFRSQAVNSLNKIEELKQLQERTFREMQTICQFLSQAIADKTFAGIPIHIEWQTYRYTIYQNGLFYAGRPVYQDKKVLFMFVNDLKRGLLEDIYRICGLSLIDLSFGEKE